MRACMVLNYSVDLTNFLPYCRVRITIHLWFKYRKRCKTDQKALKRSFGVRVCGWEKSLRQHGKTTLKYRVTRPLQHVGKISVEAKTSVCYRPLPCTPVVLLPLCTPLSPLLLQAPRCQAWIHCAHHCTRCEVASPQVEAMQARHGQVCLKRLLSRTDESRLLSSMLAIYELQA